MKRLLSIGICLLLTVASLSAQETPTIVSTEAQNRKILIEEFTGIGCGNCPRAHKTSHEIVESYPGQAFVINIHQGGYAANQNPDLRTQWGDALATLVGVKSYPTGTINRHVFSQTGTLAISDGKWKDLAPRILDMASYVNVGAKANIDWNTRKLTVDVEVYYTGNPTATSNRLNVALLQDDIPGDQSSMAANPDQVIGDRYHHMHALRNFLTGQWGEELTDIAQGKLFKQTYTQDLPEKIGNVDLKLEDLSVLVYVTESQQEVLNCSEAALTYSNAPAHIVRLMTADSIDNGGCSALGKVSLRVDNVLASTTIEKLTLEVTSAAGTSEVEVETPEMGGNETRHLDVEFPAIWNLRDNIRIRLIKVNGESYTDENFTDLELTYARWGGVVLNQALPMTINIVQDMFGEDITWTFTQEGETEVLAEGGPYRHADKPGRINTTVVKAALTPGCYRLTVLDKNKDGINNKNGEGYIEIKDATGYVVSKMDGKYSDRVDLHFYVTGVATEATEAAAYALTLTPNPVMGTDANLSIDLNRTEELLITIYNLMGMRMDQPIAYKAEAGRQQISLPTARLTAGTYMVVVTGENGRRAAAKLVVR